MRILSSTSESTPATSRQDMRKLLARKKKPAIVPKPHDRRAEPPHNATITTDQVDDPYEPGAPLLVVRSLRDDLLATMLHRNQITRCQFEAGRQWQVLWQQAEVGSMRSINPEQLRVDGGPPRDPAAHRRFRAIVRLDRIRHALGQHGNSLLRDVLITGFTLRSIAAARGLDCRPGCNDLIYLGRRLRECLDTVAHELGLA